MKQLWLLLFLSFLTAGCSSLQKDNLSKANKELLLTLNTELANRGKYEEAFKEKAFNLRRKSSSTRNLEDKYQALEELAQLYSSYSLDSTLNVLHEYREIARKSGSGDRELWAICRLAYFTANSGTISDAMALLEPYRLEDIPPELRLPYFRAQRAIAFGVVSTSNDTSLVVRYSGLRMQWRDSIIAHQQQQSYMSKMESLPLHDSLRTALALEWISSCEEYSHEWANACYHMALTLADEQDRIPWLVKASIADARNSVKDYSALTDLSRILYSQGDVTSAFHYLAEYCMPDAVTFGGRARLYWLATFFPEIEASYSSIVRIQSRRTRVFLLIISILVLALGISLIIIVLRQKALKRAMNKIEETDKIKNAYIFKFISSISGNLKEKTRTRNRILKAVRQGRPEELLEVFCGKEAEKEDVKQFYKIYDEAFLQLYPDFREKLNSLLQEDKALVPKRGYLLSPEQRIFSMVRLGVSSQGEIASALRLSAATVYNYRAAVKAKAKPGIVDFDAEVMKIV